MTAMEVEDMVAGMEEVAMEEEVEDMVDVVEAAAGMGEVEAGVVVGLDRDGEQETPPVLRMLCGLARRSVRYVHPLNYTYVWWRSYAHISSVYQCVFNLPLPV